MTERTHPYLTCWNNNSCINNYSREELEAKIREGVVNWVNRDKQRLSADQLAFYQAYLILREDLRQLNQADVTPSNEALLDRLNQNREKPFNRKDIKQLRRDVGQFIGRKGGW